MEKVSIKRKKKNNDASCPASNDVEQKVLVPPSNIVDTGDLEAILTREIPKESEDKIVDFETNGYFVEDGIYYTYTVLRNGKKLPQKISNFIMQILFHFNDGTNNTKRLIKIQHHSGEINLIEVYSNEASPDRFETILKSRRCSFLGNGYQLKLIFADLMDLEVEAVYLNKYGYNTEFDFYVMANSVIIPGIGVLNVNKLGMLRHNGKLFYLPAFAHSNIVNDEFSNDRIFVFKPGTLTFTEYAKLLYQAYGLKGITGLAFLINCLFRDVVIKETNFFPFLFLYGQPGTGKSHYIDFILKPFGEHDPGTPIKGSSAKAIARKTSQKTNALSYLKEYTNSIDPDLINFFKNGYDGTSYSIAEKSVDTRTKDFLVKSGIIIDGNELPTAENAMFDRMIIEHFEKNSFTEEEKAAHDKLLDEADNGLGNVLVEILNHRKYFEEKYKKTFRLTAGRIKSDDYRFVVQISASTKNLSDRITNHTSFLMTAIEIMKEKLDFGLTLEQLNGLTAKFLEDALEKAEMMSETSEMSVFWDAMNFERMKDRPGIIDGKHYNRDNFNKKLSLKLRDVYPFYADYCKKVNAKTLDLKTLSKVVAMQVSFLPGNQKNRGAAITKAGLGSCYQFEFLIKDDSTIIIDGKELKF